MLLFICGLFGLVALGKRAFDKYYNLHRSEMDTSSDGTPVNAVAMSNFNSKGSYNPLPGKDSISRY